MTNAVSVLVLVKGLGLGGAERLIVEQVLAGDPERIRYSVAYVRTDKNHFVPTLEEAGIEVICLGGGLDWPLRLARSIRRNRPDVVHAHSPLPASVSRVLVRSGMAGRGVRMLYTEHNRWDAYRLPTRAANALTMWLDHRTWAVSAEAASSVKPARLRRRVEPVRHGIDLEEIRRRAARPLETDEMVEMSEGESTLR